MMNMHLELARSAYGIGHSGRAQSAIQAYHRGRMAEPGAAVHIGRAQEAGQLLNQIVLLVAALGRGKKADAVRTILLQGSAQTPGHQIQSFLPGYPGPAVAMSLQRRANPILVVEDLKSCISLGAESPFTCRVLWHIFDPRGALLLDCNEKSAACAAIWTDRWNKDLWHLNPFKSSRMSRNSSKHKYCCRASSTSAPA